MRAAQRRIVIVDQLEIADLRIEPALRTEIVITSYSIHYTKLYEKPAGTLARMLGRGPRIDRIVGHAAALPFGGARFDMVWSNLMLNWLDDPTPALTEIHRVMKVGGMLMFATLGPDTLKELRATLGSAGDAHRNNFV